MLFDNSIQSSIEKDSIQFELQRSYPFYRLLSPELKERFLKRISNFIDQKNFVARKDFVLTNEIRIIVSACAIQVTFGLDSYLLDTFEYIVIYPDVYESPVTHKMHKGETNLNGFICLSWKDIKNGIDKPDDNYNLGLHEWMHALRFNGINYNTTDYFFDNYINKWVACAMHEFNLLKAGKPSIFRRYGATNIHEFLSVTTEHFFESTDEFKIKANELYIQMCILLNQEPSKDSSTKINVRDEFLSSIEVTNQNKQLPLMQFEASFWRTLWNLRSTALRFGMIIFALLISQQFVSYILATIIILITIVLMNNKYFTLKFYDDGLYLQSGFLKLISTNTFINYCSLIKLEITDEEISNGKTFEIHFYNGRKFETKTASCSAIEINKENIIQFLTSKHILCSYTN